MSDSSIWPLAIGLYQVQSLRAEEDLEAMAMKGTPHSPKLQHYRASPSDCLGSYKDTSSGRGFLLLCGNAVGAFYSHRWLDIRWGRAVLLRYSRFNLQPQPTELTSDEKSSTPPPKTLDFQIKKSFVCHSLQFEKKFPYKYQRTYKSLLCFVDLWFGFSFFI